MNETNNQTSAPAFDEIAIRKHVALIHDLAKGIEGDLIVHAIVNDTKGGGTITHHKVSDVESTVQAVMAHANTPGVNVYMPLHVMPHNLPRRSRGKLEDIVAVLGLVVDQDADTGKTGPLPIEPSYIIQTSPGNFQPAILFDKPMLPAEAIPLAKALQAATGADFGTGDVCHLWRIAGTNNLPNAGKRARGRTPIAVGLIKPFNGLVYDRERLEAALGEYMKPEETRTKDRFTGKTDTAPLFDGLSDLAQADLTTSSVKDRSKHLSRVVERLAFEKLNLDQIISLIIDHGGAYKDKHDEKLLIQDIERCWNKFGKKHQEKTREDDPHDLDGDTIDAETLLGMEFEPLSFVVPGYVTEGLTVVAGKPKLGKSWLAYDFGMAVSTGTKAMGTVECEQGDVLYLALEDNRRRVQDRLNMLLPPFRERDRYDLSRFKIRNTSKCIHNGLLDELENWRLASENPRLIIIDVYMKVRPPRKGSEDAYAADYAAVIPLQRYASENRLAVVIITHTRKMEAEDPLESVSGTNGVTGAADAILVLARGSNGTTLYGRGRDIEEIETALSFNAGRWTILGNADDVHRSEERNKIIAVLRASMGEMTPTAIADAAGLKPNNVRVLLAKMVAAGEICKARKGYYSVPWQADKAA